MEHDPHPAREGAARPRRALALAAAALLAACAGGVGAHAPVATTDVRGGAAPERPAHAGAAPIWVAEPVSWGKLERIEDWLDRHPNPHGHWYAEAVLQLAEGRLELARDDHRADPTVVERRVRRAEIGFGRVLALHDASPSQRDRASAALESLRTGHARRTSAPARPAGWTDSGGYVARVQWGARPARPSNMTRTRGAWRWITVHHSALYGGDGSVSGSVDAVRRIQTVHMRDEGFGDVGYHFLIDARGRVFEGRSLLWQGAHAGHSTTGRNNNVRNIGICLLGNFEEEHPTRAALASLEHLVSELQDHYRIPDSKVKPHSYWKGTLCPGTNLLPWFERRG